MLNVAADYDLFIYLFIYLCIYVFIYLSIYLFIYVYIYLSNPGDHINKMISTCIFCFYFYRFVVSV